MSQAAREGGVIRRKVRDVKRFVAHEVATTVLTRYGLAMSSRPLKRSLTLHGHRTSVSLEAPFWDAFREIAAARQVPLNQLAAEVDDARSGDEGLASAIRLFVLAYYRPASA